MAGADIMQEAYSFSGYRFGHDAQHTYAYLCPAILKALSRLNAKTVLEIGCGNGTLAKAIADHGMKIAGLDPSESGIENARKILPESKFYCMNVYDDPARIENNDLDAVVAAEVIEHLFRPRALLRFAHAKLRPGGFLLLTTPYHGYLKNLALSFLDKWDFHHAPQTDGGHIKFWSRRSLTRVLQKENFEVVDFVGAGRLPYLWKSMLLVAQKTG